jgi:hypothetical protein
LKYTPIHMFNQDSTPIWSLQDSTSLLDSTPPFSTCRHFFNINCVITLSYLVLYYFTVIMIIYLKELSFFSFTLYWYWLF